MLRAKEIRGYEYKLAANSAKEEGILTEAHLTKYHNMNMSSHKHITQNSLKAK